MEMKGPVLVAVLFLASAGCGQADDQTLSAQGGPDASETSVESGAAVETVVAELHEIGVEFLPAANSVVPLVSQDEATELALKAVPEGDPERSTAIPGHYRLSQIHMETKSAAEAGSPATESDPVVWLVTFKGVETPVFGPAGASEGVRPATELNAVVDASTGEVLQLFSYK